MNKATAIIIIIVTVIIMSLGVGLLKEGGGTLGIIGFAVIFFVISQLKKMWKSTDKEWEEVTKEDDDKDE